MVNKATLDLIKEFEGFKAKAYQDAVGVWTIGYGITANAGIGVKPIPGMTVTRDQAEKHLDAAVTLFAHQVTQVLTRPANENQFGAMVSLAYNIGPAAFRRSSVLRLFNAGDFDGAAEAFLLWNKAGGKVLRGLVRRREAEKKLFLTPPASRPIVSAPTTTPAAPSPWAAILNLFRLSNPK